MVNKNAVKKNAAHDNPSNAREHPKKTYRTGPLMIAGAAAMGVVTASVGIITPPAFADDYPSWNDVQQAKQNVSEQQALVERITGLIQGLQQQVDAANVVAEKSAEAYFQAKDALDAATKKANVLQSQADKAAKKAKTSKMRAGLLASHLARTGGQDTSVQLMLKGNNSHAAGDLLYQLGTMSNLTQQSKGIYDQAVSDKNESDALSAQAKSAKAERTKLSAAAQTALAAAQKAQADAQGALATQQQKSTELTAQLAALKNTSASVEASYLQGEQIRAAQAAAAKAAAEAEAQRQHDAEAAREANAAANARVANSASSSSSNSSVSSGGGGGGGYVGAPNGNAVQDAIAYAMDQLGKPYIFGAEGPYGYDCSGLTMMAYSYAGIDIGSHSVNNQWFTAAGHGQIVSYSQRQPGDLIFWGGGPGSFYHIAIYIGNNQIIAAPTEGENVKIQYVWGSPYGAVARPSA